MAVSGEVHFDQSHTRLVCAVGVLGVALIKRTSQLTGAWGIPQAEEGTCRGDHIAEDATEPAAHGIPRTTLGTIDLGTEGR